jgi:squalene-hopene/tetraprenyl-beta-curcumene cyclase
LSARGNTAIAKAMKYLETQQNQDGGWQAPSDPPGMTAIVLKTFAQEPTLKNEPFVQKGFKQLLSFQKPDGSISSDALVTYNTAIAISALAATGEPQYKTQLDKSLAYLRELQWTDKIAGVRAEMSVGPANVNFGGFGYGARGRADLSNVQTALDALHDAGLKSDDPAFQAALKFVSRTQNSSETNDQKWASGDGGFIYTAEGSSPAGQFTGPDGRVQFRSYGSMTYAGLKSMIYAGLTKDDPRVKAAWGWIGRNWTLDENPGLRLGSAPSANNGVFYYYHTLARALHAYGEPLITDTKGVKHDWRAELIAKLEATQSKDGSWIGSEKWMENRPILSTTFAVLSLQEAMSDLHEHPSAERKGQ